jgi:hypothetical protein
MIGPDSAALLPQQAFRNARMGKDNKAIIEAETCL